MGSWDGICVCCSAPIHLSKNDLNKKLEWLINLILIINDTNTIIDVNAHKGYYNDSGEIKILKKDYVITPANWNWSEHYGDNYGIVCHKDCYKLLQDELGYNLLFSNVCRLMDDYNSILRPKSKYGKMAKYVEQFFDIDSVKKEDMWMLESPLKNNENKQRILKIWRPLVVKFKNNPPRNSPCISATLYKPGEIKIGHDKKNYIVKKHNGINKWVVYDENNTRKLSRKKGSKKSKKKI